MTNKMTLKSPMLHIKHEVQSIKPLLIQLSDDTKTLLLITKQLRRLKRRLFLEATRQPETNADKFRQLILNLALDESSTAEMSSFSGSVQSFPSMQSINEGAASVSPVGCQTAQLDCLAQPSLVQWSSLPILAAHNHILGVTNSFQTFALSDNYRALRCRQSPYRFEHLHVWLSIIKEAIKVI